MVLLAVTRLLTPWDVLGIEVAAGVGAAGLVGVAWRARRAARDAAGQQSEGKGLARRRFLEQGVLAVFAAALVGLVTSAVDYVVTAAGRSGRIYRLGSADAPGDHLRSSPELAGTEAGSVALDQACTPAGCRVTSCRCSQWFECN